jgi:hypothetical protein
VTYEKDQDINQKIKKKIQAICGTACRTLNGKTREDLSCYWAVRHRQRRTGVKADYRKQKFFL